MNSLKPETLLSAICVNVTVICINLAEGGDVMWGIADTNI